MKNTRFLFAVLSLALVASLYWGWQNYPRIQRVTSGNDLAGEGGAGQPIAVESGNRLNFGTQDEVKYHPPKRDLFAALFPPPKVEKPKIIPQVVKPPQPEVAVVPPPPPPPPPVVRETVSRMPAFKVLGFLEKKEQLTAFISLRDEIFLVHQGQTFAEEYRVDELTSKTITIARTQGAGRVSLPLDEAGNKAGAGANGATLPGGHPPIGGMQ